MGIGQGNRTSDQLLSQQQSGNYKYFAGLRKYLPNQPVRGKGFRDNFGKYPRHQSQQRESESRDSIYEIPDYHHHNLQDEIYKPVTNLDSVHPALTLFCEHIYQLTPRPKNCLSNQQKIPDLICDVQTSNSSFIFLFNTSCFECCGYFYISSLVYLNPSLTWLI